jgi:FliI/YscN family ATPase
VIGRPTGAVVATRGGLVEADLPGARVGGGVWIRAAGRDVAGEVVALRGGRAVVAPWSSLAGVAVGDPVAVDNAVLRTVLGTPLFGRALDASGAPLDGDPPPRGAQRLAPGPSPAVGERQPCRDVCWTGIRAIDGPLPLGRGARIGVVGAAGTGKTMLLEAIVRGTDADAVVVALIGERGREAERRVNAVDARTTVVCATADRSPAERVRAADLAFAQAEALRARGLDVLLVLDSLARVCAAARELALAAGEPVGRGGYPPSVFARLAGLLERAGALGDGSVTLVATVLSEGPDEHDPVAEAARAALDGHLVLNERLARAGRFPALDLPRSVSRTAAEVATPEHLRGARRLREAVGALEESREARALGLDVAAGDPFLACCLRCEGEIERFLRQDGEPSPPASTLRQLRQLADTIDNGRLR